MKTALRASAALLGASLIAGFYGYVMPAFYDAGYCSEQVALGGPHCNEPTPLPIPYWGPWPPPNTRR